MAKEQFIRVDGHRLKVTNLDKVLYPETGTTKGEVIGYYQTVAPLMVPQAAWRPATRKRWPDGVGTPSDPGEVFFQKNLETFAPEWIPRFRIEHSHRAAFYPLANSAAVLAWFGQVAALEVHTPQWRFDPSGNRQNPDRIVLDLDPGPGAGLPECAEVARICRGLLDDMGMPSVPVTSGSKGIHLYAALDGKHTSEQVSAVAQEIARALEADHPDLVVSSQKKTLRGGKVLVDWSQNSGSKTTICPYSLRGRARPMVAAPRTWEEIDDANLAQVDFHDVLERLDADPMAPLAFLAPTAPARSEAGDAVQDRLTVYRAKRDAAKTPEPVPSSSPEPREGEPEFVIQEHHARRLHYDFRLEHDGVLVSWAVPKGPPMTTAKNHLAVRTEDHPMEYGTFEGTIPKGEYGAGTVTIWDHGTVEFEKWRDKEVMGTLHGQPGGGLGGEPYRFVLIRTGGLGGDDNWLLHRMSLTGKRWSMTESGEAASAAPSAPASPSPPVEPSPSARAVELPTIEPMLATSGSAADLAGDEWRYEMKWDGVRAIVTVDGAVVTVRGRSGRDFTRTYPEVAEIASLVSEPCVLDAEIVALRGGRPDFGTLQQRIGLTKPAEVAAEAARTPVYLFVFDVMNVAGESLLRAPYVERRHRLESLVREGTFVKVPPSFDGSLADALDASREQRLEGVMAKRAKSTYQPGHRAKSWIKIKHRATQDVVIVGMRSSTARRAFASLLLAVPDDSGTLRYAGRVGSGFDEKSLAAISARLAPLVVADVPVDDVPPADRRDATWVTPTVVGEVEYAERTADGSLRHAVWRGLRPDVLASDVRWETAT